jgi:predicted enzyme related to lactoylglutathione lyase
VIKTLSRATLIAVVLAFSGGRTVAQESPEVWVDAIGVPQYFAIYVKDVDKSVAWYCTVFGLAKMGGSVAEDGSWRIENLGNEQLSVEIIYDSRAQEVERALGFRKVGFHVRDVEEVAEKVERATGERPRVVDFEQLGQRILQIRDPDGNTIQLFSVLEKQE